MRIFCGLANVNEAVAAALVNERGGVVATAEVSDDPHGYFALCHMWVRHADISGVLIADDGSTLSLLKLAAEAGQPVATNAPRPHGTHDGLEIAVHIARALCRGALSTGIESSEPTLGRLLISAQNLAASRHATRTALIELLRQCHPAVLMAWDDPTDDDALALLRAIPDPAEAADADAAELVGALHSVADPRIVGSLVQALNDVAQEMDPVVRHPGVAEAIVGAIDSVQACDHALDALADSVSGMMRPVHPPAPPAPPPPARNPVPPERSQAPAAPEPLQRPVPPQRAPQPDVLSAPEPSAPPSPPRHSAPTPPTSEPPMHLFEVSDPVTPAHGFPRMPEPPSFVEPLTEHLPPMRQHAESADLLSAPVDDLPSDVDAEDDDLLIFSQARSAWFKGPAALDDVEDDWTPADEGWRAAAAAAQQDEETEITGTGLPRRVPQANLVPGSAILSDSKPTPIKRDASTLASHTAGYFRGWNRARRETVGAGTR
ncbi:MAG TPA: hypothetical protein H9881_06510 [Candidatus Stackebrandtia excrementipullorum]|nr:hypothetical protein [Candidatus Stackebrandtia excrementipullorum]